MTPSLTCSPPLLVPPRLATLRTDGAPTHGPAVDAVARALFGRPLQAWQRHVADVAGEYDPDTGEALHPVYVLHVPRRAGKSALVLAKLLRRVLGQPRSQSWYTAQTGADAGRTFRREWVPILRSRGLTPGRIKTSLRSGAESFELLERGAMLTCFAPVETALHGTNVDEVCVDEAWAFDDDEGRTVEQAVFPAQLTRPGAQTGIVSAGGTLASTWLDRWLTRGEEALAAGDPSIALFDWGADAAASSYDPTDPRTWWSAHPALGDTISEAAIAGELARSSDVAAFERSILNVWPRPRTLTAQVIAGDRWQAMADLEVRAVPHVVAFDVAADRAHACLAQAGLAPDGRIVLELLDYRAGTAWLVTAVRAWLAAHRAGLVVTDQMAAGTTADRLALTGVDVIRTGPAQMARACADLLDLLEAGQLAHRAQQLLDATLAGAGRRSLGDGWAWSRKTSAGDISPLVAVTLAAWAARTRPAAAEPFVIVAR